jgi:hypothetical protein
MTKERIDSALIVINYAIKHGISVKEASVKCGYADTYVKNAKRAVIQAYDAGTLDDVDYDAFMSAYENYNNSQILDKESTITNPEEPITQEKTEFSEAGDVAQVAWTNGSPKINLDLDVEDETNGLFDYFGDPVQGGAVEPTYGYPPNHIKTLDDLLTQAEVDREEWKVARHIVNKWDVTSFQNGQPYTWENFQVKATLERRKEVTAAKNFTEIFEEMSKNYTPPVIPASAIPTKPVAELEENNLLEVSLFDLHIGKLGWAGEVGENYDTKIARARFLDAVTKLLQRAKGFTYSKILFPIGNDFFNSDNQFNTTTKGTPQDEDLRWQKTYDLGCQLIVDAIMMLKATGVPVEVPVVPGNHDQERSYYLGSFVDAWFRNDDQVNVNNSAKTRKFYEWGEVMLGFTHGNEEKEASLPLLMATEEKEMWGRTSFHEWHLGHFHKKRNVKFTVLDKAQMLNEELGVTVRYLSSLSGTEEWHYKKGYIGSQKAGEAFIWNDKSGMVGHVNFNFTDFDREH